MSNPPNIYSILKLSLMASPSLLIASVMFSAVAAAKVVLKYNPDGGLSCSARNQEPRATSTPLAMQLLKISSSMARMLLLAASGCSSWLTLSQCCHSRQYISLL